MQGMLLTPVQSADKVEYKPEDVYIFLQMKSNGPLLYHIFLWTGIKVQSSLQDAFIHVQNLAHCLPGKPVIHKEVRELRT